MTERGRKTVLFQKVLWHEIILLCVLLPFWPDRNIDTWHQNRHHQITVHMQQLLAYRPAFASTTEGSITASKTVIDTHTWLEQKKWGRPEKLELQGVEQRVPEHQQRNTPSSCNWNERLWNRGGQSSNSRTSSKLSAILWILLQINSSLQAPPEPGQITLPRQKFG